MKWKKLAIRAFAYIATAVILNNLPEPYQFVKIEVNYVVVLIFFDFVFAYFGDYGEWKEEEDNDAAN